MKLLRWFRFAWHWFLELPHVWISFLGFIVAFLIIHYRGADEATIRITGLIFQILGIGTVAWGIHKTRTFFGHPSVISFLRCWLSRFPPLRGYGITGSVNSTLPPLTGKARSHKSTSAPLNASIEERILALEENLQYIHDRISQTQSEMDQETRRLAEELNQEKILRTRDDQEILKKLEGTATGGLYITAMGALFLFFGVIMSTIPVELSKWLN